MYPHDPAARAEVPGLLAQNLLAEGSGVGVLALEEAERCQPVGGLRPVRIPELFNSKITIRDSWWRRGRGHFSGNQPTYILSNWLLEHMFFHMLFFFPILKNILSTNYNFLGKFCTIH